MPSPVGTPPPPCSPALVLLAVEVTLVPGIRPEALARLAAEGIDWPALFAPGAARMLGSRLSATAAEALASGRFRDRAAAVIEESSRINCHVFIKGYDGYPYLLTQIFGAPLVLYGRGRAGALERPAIAVVGARRPSFYGLEMASGLAADLAARGIAVVSGLARGIDAAAHRAALRAGGPTVAVLGCGLDVVYPPEHRRLTEEVAEAGLLLSEYPPGTPPLGRNFPARNRIISGVALGTVIVEAREASGSLGTARAALEQNREVFAVPGNLTSPLSAGPNFLIKQGAKLVQSWRDVLEEIPGVAGLAEPEPAPRAASGADLPPEQAALLGRIPSDRAVEFDLLAGAPGEVARLTGLLLELELRGLVRQLPGGLYVRTGRRASLGSGSGAPPRIAAKWPPK